MPRDACLYFPHIEIRDAKWTKSYILFWDEIRTIVPDVVEAPYQRKELEFLHGEGLLHAERVGLYSNEIETASKSMLANWDAIKRSAWRTNSHFRVAPDRGELSFLHPEKMSHELLHKFEQHLKDSVPDIGETYTYRDTTEWKIADPKMATAYMGLLAHEIAKKQKADPVTNYPFLRVPDPELLAKRNIIKRKNSKQLIDIIIENTIVDPDVKIDKIVSFKRKNQALFNDFRDELESLRLRTEYGDSRADLTRLYERRIAPKVQTLRSSLRRNFLGWTAGGCIALPAVADSAAANAELFGASPEIALASTCGMVLTGVVLGSSVTRDRSKEPMSYLADIDRRFVLPPWRR